MRRCFARALVASVFVLAATTSLAQPSLPAPTTVWSIPQTPGSYTAVLYADDEIGVQWTAGVGLEGVSWTTQSTNWTLSEACSTFNAQPMNAFATRPNSMAYACLSNDGGAELVQLDTRAGAVTARTAFSTASDVGYGGWSGTPHVSLTTGTMCFSAGWCVFANGTLWTFGASGTAPLVRMYNETLALIRMATNIRENATVTLYSAASGDQVAKFELPATFTYSAMQNRRYLAFQLAEFTTYDTVLLVDLQTRALLPTAVPLMGLPGAMLIGAYEQPMDMLVLLARSGSGGGLNSTLYAWFVPVSLFTGSAYPVSVRYSRIVPSPLSATTGLLSSTWAIAGGSFVMYSTQRGTGQLLVLQLATGQDVVVPSPLEPDVLSSVPTMPSGAVLASTGGATQKVTSSGTAWYVSDASVPPCPWTGATDKATGCSVLSKQVSADQQTFVCVK